MLVYWVEAWENKDKIIKAAVSLIEAHGADSLTVRRICEKAELATGTFYYHFKNKDDLLMHFVCGESFDVDFDETGYCYTLSLISGKYKPVILYCLMEYEPVRFNDMKRYLKQVADKTLSLKLKELEADGLIVRTVVAQMPPKVEYSLTERGHSLVKVLDKLCDWGIENRPKKQQVPNKQ
ncbi:MAG: winged helix-turn-helix transcriptional regulator [Selenomonadaceae bacterium]|nr:winged helix-turn-helix transcriptional regulator [Selenomonadaceae bacterium]